MTANDSAKDNELYSLRITESFNDLVNYYFRNYLLKDDHLYRVFNYIARFYLVEKMAKKGEVKYNISKSFFISLTIYDFLLRSSYVDNDSIVSTSDLKMLVFGNKTFTFKVNPSALDNNLKNIHDNRYRIIKDIVKDTGQNIFEFSVKDLSKNNLNLLIQLFIDYLQENQHDTKIKNNLFGDTILYVGLGRWSWQS